MSGLRMFWDKLTDLFPETMSSAPSVTMLLRWPETQESQGSSIEWSPQGSPLRWQWDEWLLTMTRCQCWSTGGRRRWLTSGLTTRPSSLRTTSNSPQPLLLFYLLLWERETFWSVYICATLKHNILHNYFLISTKKIVHYQNWKYKNVFNSFLKIVFLKNRLLIEGTWSLLQQLSTAVFRV